MAFETIATRPTSTRTTGLPAMLARTIDEVRGRWNALMDRRRSYNAIMTELRRLDDRDLADLNISRADFDDIASGRPLEPRY